MTAPRKTFNRKLRYRGPWNESTTYQPGEMVQTDFGEGQFAFAICTVANKGQDPTDAAQGSGGSDYWDVEF